MSYNWLLLLHLSGAFLFVSGALAAAVLRIAAIRQARPSEAALLLGAVRPVVPLIGLGVVLVLVFGFWLADDGGWALGSSWLVATFALLGWTVVLGAVAGRADRHTRELAERLAAAGDEPSAELARRLRDPVSLALNGSMLVAVSAIVVLMVFKPGA